DAQTGEWSVGAGNNYVLNPSFDADRVSQSTLAGWKASGSGCGNANGARTGRWCGQLYSGSNFSGKQTQDIALPNGTYTLKAYYKTSGMNSGKIYISGYGGSEKNVDVKAKTDNWKEITISDIQVTSGKCTVGFEAAGNGGAWLKVDDFSLIRNGQPPEPVKYADGKYITGLTVSDTANAANWSVVTQPKQQGSEVFGDRAFRFTSVPKTLDGAEWIQTACDSKKFAGDEATFKAGADISAFVALDTRVTVPAWLGDWTKTADTLTDDGDPQVTYQLWKKDFTAGQTVTLGEINQSSCVNYAVAVTKKQVLTVTGDINADGICDKTDLVMMRDYLLTTGTLTKEQGAIADMNADGKLNAVDLTLLKHILLK
ncbi:MAG: dockerin type I repeat-containing protein, partial [Oscillospiraceae bacterium]|nr:dockerin type I repeat-containing protein [Oscillospiraceae bacterium]